MEHRFWTINCGIPAVVLFFMLSGFVVTHLKTKFFGNDLRSFYAERFLRIYPLYFACLVLSAAFVFSTRFGDPFLSLENILANLTVVPLNYFQLVDFAVLSERNKILLPTAWSLGLEIHAYILLPLVLKSERLKWITGLLSLLIFSVGSLREDVHLWCYHLLPGVFFAFLVGAAVCTTLRRPGSADRFDQHFPALSWAWLLALLMLEALTQRIQVRALEFSLGFLLGVPVLIFTSRAQLRLPFDAWLGQISYGVFLTHFPAIWLYEWLNPGEGIGSGKAFLFVIGVSFATSAVLCATVERIIWPLRQKLSAPNPPKPTRRNARPALAVVAEGS